MHVYCTYINNIIIHNIIINNIIIHCVIPGMVNSAVDYYR